MCFLISRLAIEENSEIFPRRGFNNCFQMQTIVSRQQNISTWKCSVARKDHSLILRLKTQCASSDAVASKA